MSDYKIEWRSSRLQFAVSGRTAPGKIRKWVIAHLPLERLRLEIQRLQWRRLIVQGRGTPTNLTLPPRPIVADDAYSHNESLLHRPHVPRPAK